MKNSTARLQVAICVALSAVAFFFSLNQGSVWPLAWVAPVPVLYLALGGAPPGTSFWAAWAAYALGATNIVVAYAGALPWPGLVLGVVGPALYFAASARAAGFVGARLGDIAGVLAFAALWTSCDFLASLGGDGTEPSPAYSQVGAPILIQSASLFGLWIVTFLLGTVSAGLAMSLHKRRILPALLAILVLGANVAFGEWHLLQGNNVDAERVGLGADDSVSLRATRSASQQLAVAKRYADAARALARSGAHLVVFPEKVSFLGVQARAPILTILRTAAHASRTTIVIGFDDRSAEPRNEAIVFPPDGSQPNFYFKRHMVGGLEDIYVPGDGPVRLEGSAGAEICKDMDFPEMLREDVRKTKAKLLAVPAWDFGSDRWWHARLAIMRAVENGVSIARAAKNGLLTLADSKARVVAERPSSEAGMVTLVGDLSVGAGDTLYLRLGNAFAWVCLAASILLIGFAFVRAP